MKEQEFRARLKRAAMNDGLSTERQMQVLARAKGDEAKVKNWNKVKFIAVAAVILVMGMSGAVAAGLGGVDWHGQPALPPPEVYLADTETGARLQELINEAKEAKVISLRALDAPMGTVAGVTGSRSDLYLASVAEVKALVEADGTLPWLVMIPEEYDQLDMGRVAYGCEGAGHFNLVSQELTEDNYLRTYFEIPEEHRFMRDYFLRMKNDAGQKLSISVSMTNVYEWESFAVDEDSYTTVLNVEGMDQALAIESPDETVVALRRMLQEPLRYKIVDGGMNLRQYEYVWEYECLQIKITGQGTPEDLLAIFGLTAK